MSAAACMRMYEPHKQVSSDSEPFVIPNLPGEIKLTKKQVPDFLKNEEETDMTEFLNALRASHGKNYGTLVNSFYELEQPYVEFQKNVLKSKVWHIGPVFLSNSSGTVKNTEQNESLIKWLDSKKPSSVVYICFGSISTLGESQLREIELGLEASGQQFILVVSKTSKKFDGNQGEEKEVEVTSEGKGLIIRGWAPQVLILNHQAVGGFVTHCGWNSILEGVCAGLPMVTWPGSADQFYNEKFLTDVLKIGVSIGAQEYWVTHAGETVKKEAIEKAVKQLLAGDEAVELRNRAKGLSEMAKQAVKEGGSSYSDLNVFMEELKARRH
ncbi:Glycosyltransferase [Quillaja saponaria]|uniref:Glycosyltransferase n=1 Tax=Quillaja saponaria TaxID=32244 RepID=A0AAD7LVW0_QUISA|nr:Glycosyltransferase [Quillaja saponaria]